MARGDFQSIATGSDQAVQQWLAGLAREVIKSTKLYKTFRGRPFSSMPIIQRDDLKKEPGDTIKFDYRPKLLDRPVFGGGWLRGAESIYTIYQTDVTISSLAYAHAVKGKLDNQRTVHNLFKEGRTLIREALAEQLEQLLITLLSGENFQGYAFNSQGVPGPLINYANVAATVNTWRLYGGTATSKATIADGDDFTTTLIERFVKYAKKAKFTDNSGTTTTMLSKMRKIAGSFFLMLVSASGMDQLYNDTDFENALLYAAIRGKENPLFQDVDARWKGTAIMEHDGLHEAEDYGTGSPGVLPGVRSLFLGAEAGCLAATKWLGLQDYTMQIDYTKSGIAVESIIGFNKTAWNSKDFAVMALDTMND